MKTYELEEAIKMLKENNKLEFETIREGDNNSILSVNKLGHLVCEDKKSGSDEYIVVADKWKLIQHPVSFMEAVKSTKRVKVEHGYILVLIRGGQSYLKDHMTFARLMGALGNRLASSELKEVILNGEWYIEE